MKTISKRFFILAMVPFLLPLLMAPLTASAQTNTVNFVLKLKDSLGPMEIGRLVSFSQGGLSEDPMWINRVPEIRALGPKVIRLFAQEYINELPARGRYNWTEMDKSVDLVEKTGAHVLIDITFRPKLLFPKKRIGDPTSWQEWENLIYDMVRHYKMRGSHVRYWEIGDEGEIGEASGVPYFFTPETYGRFYEHTVKAIRRADPQAKVVGPAVASLEDPMMSEFLTFVDTHKVPLDVVSWHIYTNDPQRIRNSIDVVKSLLTKHPSLHPETYLGEWNVSLENPPLDQRYQPCFIAETIYQMRDAGLDLAGYYHIRDYHVKYDSFAQFMTPEGAAGMTNAWNRGAQVQVSGLFDFQNTIRPAYFSFKMLSRLTGERLRFEPEGQSPSVHGFATRDAKLGLFYVLLWNFSETPAEVDVTIDGSSSDLRLTGRELDALAASNDENVRLKPLPATILKNNGRMHVPVELGPYGVTSLTMQRNTADAE